MSSAKLTLSETPNSTSGVLLQQCHAEWLRRGEPNKIKGEEQKRAPDGQRSSSSAIKAMLHPPANDQFFFSNMLRSLIPKSLSSSTPGTQSALQQPSSPGTGIRKLPTRLATAQCPSGLKRKITFDAYSVGVKDSTIGHPSSQRPPPPSTSSLPSNGHPNWWCPDVTAAQLPWSLIDPGHHLLDSLGHTHHHQDLHQHHNQRPWNGAPSGVHSPLRASGTTCLSSMERTWREVPLGELWLRQPSQLRTSPFFHSPSDASCPSPTAFLIKRADASSPTRSSGRATASCGLLVPPRRVIVGGRPHQRFRSHQMSAFCDPRKPPSTAEGVRPPADGPSGNGSINPMRSAVLEKYGYANVHYVMQNLQKIFGTIRAESDARLRLSRLPPRCDGPSADGWPGYDEVHLLSETTCPCTRDEHVTCGQSSADHEKPDPAGEKLSPDCKHFSALIGLEIVVDYVKQNTSTSK